MDEEDGHVHDLRHGDGAVRALAFHGLGTRDGVEVRRNLALALQLGGEPGDAVGVLRVDHDHGALVARQGEDGDDLAVAQLERLVGHVDLERRVALADEGGELLAQHGVGGIRDDQVKAVVDDGLSPRAPVIVLDGRTHALPLELAGERHHGGGAAVSGRHRAREEVVGEGDRVPHRLIEVAVGVDAPGEDVAAGRVDLAASGTEATPERGHHAVGNAEIGLEDIGCRRDHRIPDDRVELRHGRPSLRGTAAPFRGR